MLRNEDIPILVEFYISLKHSLHPLTSTSTSELTLKACKRSSTFLTRNIEYHCSPQSFLVKQTCKSGYIPELLASCITLITPTVLTLWEGLVRWLEHLEIPKNSTSRTFPIAWEYTESSLLLLQIPYILSKIFKIFHNC